MPIHYDSKKAPKSKIDESSLWEWDIKGFNSKVGFVTNCATSAFALLPSFKEGSREYTTTIDRLKCFRKEQGSTIDATKGLIIKPFPLHWTRWRNVKGVPPQDIDEINFLNSIVINKRPLFMRYVYTGYNKKYLDFNRRYGISAKIKFGSSLEELLTAHDRGELDGEKESFVHEYLRYIPFILSDCLMNKVCRFMEAKVKTLREDIRLDILDDNVSLLKSLDQRTDTDLFKKLYAVYKRYKSEKKAFLGGHDTEEGGKKKTLDQFNKYVRLLCLEISEDTHLLSDMAVDICYVLHPSDNKSFLWNIFGEEIVDNLISKSESYQYPVRDDEGPIEYLWNRYSIKTYELRKDVIYA